MISNVIQGAVQAVIPNTFQSIGDENITVPFVIHEESEVPIYLKTGIAAYEWIVECGIIHNTPDAAASSSLQVIQAITLLEGTMNSGIIIDSVEYMGSSVGFDERTKEYLKMVRFTISGSKI